MKIVHSKIIAAAFFFGVTAYAGPTGPPPPGVPPPGLPIDGGVVALFTLAIGYGLYKIYRLRFNKKTPA
jgi:hypothetical protein